ncbi:MAG: hypothetical protein IJC33_07775 [Clostridia bacterium]|nr:hypothetical protein [Clostridia bacterium]
MGRMLSKNVLLAVLCCAALMLSCFFSVAAFERAGQPEQKLFDRMVEEDGHIFGINFPWMQIGHTLTNNDLMEKYDVGYGDPSTVALDVYGEEYLYEGLLNLKAIGYRAIGYWGSTCGEGILYDDYGNVLGVKEDYLANIDRFLAVCRRAEMPVLWIVAPHTDYLTGFGEDGVYAWHIINQSIVNPEVTEQYMEKFVRPVLEVLARNTDVVFMISAGCEAENEVNDPKLGNHFEGDRTTYGTSLEKMSAFLRRITDMVAEIVPSASRTLVTNASYLNVYNDFNLDTVGINSYSFTTGFPEISKYNTVHPMIASEWSLGNVASEEQYMINTVKRQETIVNNGYLASFFWCYSGIGAGDQHSLHYVGAAAQSDFRPMVYAMHYFIEDYRNEFHGIESELDTPRMLYNRGSGTVEWIGVRQTDDTTIDIQRSMNGGQTWTTLVEGAPVMEYETDYKGVYHDETLPKTGRVTYRVIVRNGDIENVSDPSNEAEILAPAPELLINGSFEDGLTGWDYLFTDEPYVSTDYATEGSHSLYLTGTAWTGVIQEHIPVVPGKRYSFTCNYRKDAKDTKQNNAFVWIRYGEGGGTQNSEIQDTCGYMNTSKQGWHAIEHSFVIPEGVTEIAIDIRVDDPATWGGVKGMFYVDEVSLKEVR